MIPAVMAFPEKLRHSLLILGLAVATVSIVAAMFASSLEGRDRLWPLSWIGWAPVGFWILLRRPGNGVTRGMMTIGVTSGISFLTLPLVVALATLAAAALFNPLRRRVQPLIDRRFSRSQYDTREIIEDFAGSLRDRLDANGLIQGWVGVVSQTMQPHSVGVWGRDAR